MLSAILIYNKKSILIAFIFLKDKEIFLQYQQTAKHWFFQSLWLNHGLLLLLSIYLYSSPIHWIFIQLTQTEHRFSQISLFLLLVFVIYQVILANHSTKQASLNATKLQLNLNPLAITGFILMGCAFLLNESFFAINIFSAVCAITAFYALLGLFINQYSWQRGLLYAIIFLLFLPFGDYLDVFFGFPLRLASAEVASDLLMVLGYAPQNIQTLIELDNQLAYVDLSCSGIHGLWSGIGFFVLLTWIEQKAIGLRWLGIFILFLILILSFNVLRITLMVMIDVILQQSQLAELLHNSLGIIGFAVACLSAWLMISQLIPNRSEIERVKIKQNSKGRLSKYHILASWLLSVIASGFIYFYTPVAKETMPVYNTMPKFSDNWYERKILLNSQEKSFFPRQGAFAQKFSFNHYQQIPGSLVFVNTLYWKAHHNPSLCFQAQGYTLLNEKTRRFDHEIMVKELELNKDGKAYKAYYWFQSKEEQTADFSQRLFSGFLAQIQSFKQPWTMVSLIVQRTNALNVENEIRLIWELSEITTDWVAKLPAPNSVNKGGKVQ